MNCGRASIERDVSVFIKQFLVQAGVGQDPNQDDPGFGLQSDRIPDASLVIKRFLAHQIQSLTALE